MKRAGAYSEALRAISVGILAVFVFGSASGPLRTCLNHPAHASGAHAGVQSAPVHAAEHAAEHGADTPSDHVPTSDHEGCSCLGRCSLENAPALPGSSGPTLAHSPDAPGAVVPTSVSVFTRPDPSGLPLARPPPAVV